MKISQYVFKVCSGFFFGSLLLTHLAQALEFAFERDDSLPIVNLVVAIKAGSASDPENKLGLTRFMAKMLLRGTKNQNKETINSKIDQMGSSLETEVNSESFSLNGAVLSSELQPYLDLVSDILTTPSFPENEIKKLKSETLTSILQAKNNDETLADESFKKILFGFPPGGHPYGHPVLGTSQSVKSFTKADLLFEYNQWVSPDRLIVIGTGSANPEVIRTWAQKLATKIPNVAPKRVLLPPLYPVKKQIVIIDKPDRTQTQIYGGQIGVKMNHPDFFPLYVGNYILGGSSFKARLMSTIRVKNGWSYGAYSFFKNASQPHSWRFWLFPANKDAPVALAESLRLIQEVREKGVTAEELEKTRKTLINNSMFDDNTPKKRLQNTLAEFVLGLPQGFLKKFPDEFEKITLAEVNTALGKFLKPDAFSIVIVGTASKIKQPLAHALAVNPQDIRVIPYLKE